MKYIYFSVAILDADWLTKVEDAKTETASKNTEKERKTFIAGRSKVWRDFKPNLEKLSHGKCWYTEARDKVSYWEVDHYRPKKLYPWLAFEWRNFRLCGSKPNRKKTDEFPLQDEASRSTMLAPDFSAELPLLLDPIRWGDPDLLTFKADGEPTCAVPTDGWITRRVKETIAAIGLDGDILCEERREKWRKCESKLKRLRDLVENARQMENDDAGVFCLDLCQDINELFDDRAEFTATAKACSAQLHASDLVDLARELSQRALQNAA